MAAGRVKSREKHSPCPSEVSPLLILEKTKIKNAETGSTTDAEEDYRKSSLHHDFESQKGQRGFDNVVVPEGENFPRGDDEQVVSYLTLLRTNRSYTLYICSLTAAHIGEWMTLVATINALQRITSESQSAVAMIFILKLLPSVFISGLGGVIADMVDRRHEMIVLDIAGALVVLLYVPVVAYGKSVILLYAVILVQASISALYDPARQAILPMVTKNEKEMKLAITMTGIIWSSIAAMGAFVGGLVVSRLGVNACFGLDCFTYTISAFLIWCLGGTWTAQDTSSDKNTLSSASKGFWSRLWTTYVAMTIEGAKYIRSSEVLPFVLLKGSGGIVWGAADPLNVRFAHIDGDDGRDSERLGLLYGSVGVACLMGPLLADIFTDASRPSTNQFACLIAFGLVSVGFFGWTFFDSFLLRILFSFIRCIGSSIIWINSTFLTQKYASKEMMGRVMSVDVILITFSEAVSTYAAGFLQDNVHLDEYETSLTFAMLGGCVFAIWGLYHVFGDGVACLKNIPSAL